MLDQGILQLALACAERALQPSAYYLPENYLSRERFEEVLHTLDNTSSPGIPYTDEAPTIGEWLKFDGFEYDPTQRERLWIETKLVLEGHWIPTYRVFIKKEAHTRIKAQDGRWRLIFGFPLNVQVAWKMLFDYGNISFLDHSLDIPIQHGLKLVQGDWMHYYRKWRTEGLNCSTDISAFDWSVTWPWIELVLALRTRLAKGPHVEGWTVYARRLYELAFKGVILQFSNGEVCSFSLAAVQKSGSPNTIADNGMIRYLRALYVRLRHGLPMHPPGAYVGDDALERVKVEDFPRLREMYKEVGLTVKTVEEGIDFVGHRFVPSGPLPAYIEKHMWNLVHQPGENLPDYLDQMARMYAHSPLEEFWQDIALECGVFLASPEYYRTWYDTERDDFPAYSRVLGSRVV